MTACGAHCGAAAPYRSPGRRQVPAWAGHVAEREAAGVRRPSGILRYRMRELCKAVTMENAQVDTLFDPSAMVTGKVAAWQYQETEFEYLQTSDRPEMARARELMNHWFADYPDEHKQELQSRFKSGPLECASPFFELLLHALFVALGATVEVHPAIGANGVVGTGKRPDFLVSLKSGYAFYLEARVATGLSVAEAGAETRLHKLKRDVNARLKTTDYFLIVEERDIGPSQPSATALATLLDLHLQSLDPRAVISAASDVGARAALAFPWRWDGWDLVFHPFPRKADASPPSCGSIAGSMAPPRFTRAHEDIRTAVARKTSRYGTLDLPFVIAVNAMDFAAGPDDFVDALYGREIFSVAAGAAGPTEVGCTRERDGVWPGAPSSSARRVAAVLGGCGLVPTTAACGSVVLYRNPLNQLPEGTGLECLPACWLDGGSPATSGGCSLGHLFGLPLGWPRADA